MNGLSEKEPDLGDYLSLKGRVAIVTGAGSGIGRGIALEFARRGADVAVCARNRTNVEETSRQVEQLGSATYFDNFDGADENCVSHFVAEVTRRLGAPTILVTNASTMPFGDLTNTSVAEMDACYGSKMKATVLFAKQCVGPMKAAGGGSMIFMASVTGNQGFARFTFYGAMNSAVIGFARGLAMELAPFGIRVNTVSPGTVDAPMLHRFEADLGVDPIKLRAAIDASHPRGQIASIEEVVAPFLFLASDGSSNITGHDLRCDGGLSAKGG